RPLRGENLDNAAELAGEIGHRKSTFKGSRRVARHGCRAELAFLVRQDENVAFFGRCKFGEDDGRSRGHDSHFRHGAGWRATFGRFPAFGKAAPAIAGIFAVSSPWRSDARSRTLSASD